MAEENKKTENENKEEKEKKKLNNLIAAVILLSGLFIGSLFVDVLQMIRGRGFSQKALEKTDVVVMDGRTWVAYNESAINIKVFSETNCEECSPDQFLVWLRRLVPTMVPEKIEVNTEEGLAMAKKFGIVSVPSFVFAKEIDKTDFFNQASQFFKEIEGHYVLNNAEIGLPPGKFIALPEISEGSIVIGPNDAKVKLIEFSDFQCPYCKAFQINTVHKILEEYEDKVQLVFKNLPLDFHPQATQAAEAAYCAHEQGKFVEYSKKLFEAQDEWGKIQDNKLFKAYALRLGLNSSDFNKCLDEKRYQSRVEAEKAEASKFGISGTPAIFINNNFKSGAIDFEEIKKIIDEELAK